MEPVKVLQSELEHRQPTESEQAELDRRIGADEELFDKEEAAKAEESKKKEEKPEEKDEKEDEETDEEKARKILEKKEEEKKILDSKEEDLDDDTKAKKAELLKKKEEEKSSEENSKILEEDIKAYAKENEISEDDAKKDLESISKITENFKGDAKKIAKSYFHMQRLQGKTVDELKTLKEASSFVPQKQVTVKSVMELVEAGQLKMQGKPVTQEEVVDAYREKYPDVTEGAEDDTIFKMACKDIKENMAIGQRNQSAKLEVDAKERKAKLLGSLSESAKKFIPTLEPVLDKLSPAQIMSENFSLEDLVLWAKGKTHDDEIKVAEERGFTRGVEARKILGEIKKPSEGKPKTKSSGGKSPLTELEKNKAEAMFENDDIPLEKKYEYYEEIIEHDKQLKEKKEK